MAVLENVVFAYVKIQSPVKKYQSEDTEFSVDAIVSKSQAKAWNKQFPKQKAKEIDNADFSEKYKMEVPFSDQDEQYVIKVKKPHVKGGVEQPEKYRPRVFVAVSGAKAVDRTFDVLPANGSKGKVSYRETSNDFGNFASLNSILVEELIEYKSGGVDADFDVDKESIKEVPKNQQPVKKQTDAKKVDKEEEPEQDFEMENSPF